MSEYSSNHSNTRFRLPLSGSGESNANDSNHGGDIVRAREKDRRSIPFSGNRLSFILYIVFFLVTMIPVLLILIHQYGELKRTQVTELKVGLNQASRSMKNDMEHMIAIGFEGLEHLAGHTDLRQWVDRVNDLSVAESMDEKARENLIHDTRMFGLESIMVSDISGRILMAWPETEALDQQVMFGPFMHQDWAKVAVRILDGGGRFISPPLAEGSGNADIFAYICLSIADDYGRIIGTVTGGLGRKLFQERVGNHSVFLNPHVQQEIINGDFQKCLSFQNSKGIVKVPEEKKGPYAQASDDWGQGLLMFRDSNGDRYVGVRDQLKHALTLENPWYIQTAIPLAPMNFERTQFKRFAMLVVAVVFGFTILVAWSLAHVSTRVIRQYLVWARHMADGNVMTLTRPRGHHDIAELGKELSSLSERMVDLVHFCEAASMGDFSRPFDIRGEKDSLGRNINGVRNYFHSIMLKVRSISEGKYALEIPEGTANDELSPTLKKLAEALNRMNDDNMRQITATLAQVELVRKISENRNLDAMIDHVLSFFCQYMKSEIGVFYVHDPEKNRFVRIGTYGTLANDFPEHLEPGQGLCGQAVIEKIPLIAEIDPENAPIVASGLSRKPARSILAFPFILRDRVIGVMELGSIGDLKPEYLDYIKQNNESIAIGIHSAQAQQLTETLLEKTIEQSKKLTAHQEKLSRTNREMAEQTRALKQSEIRLMAREEELEKANQALEIRSKQLEEQKDSLDLKNRELIETKSILEIKAEELTQSNLYKSEFLANMSHELRTPLNSIILLSKLMGDKLGVLGDTQNTKFAQIINNSGKELLNLIDEVLDLTRVTSGDMEIKPVRYELYDIAKVMSHWYDKHITEKTVSFDVTLGPHLPDDVVTDPQKLERILKCLMSNAFKYTEKGSVLMEIKRPSSDTDLTDMGLSRESTVEFSIQDTGQGVPEDKQQLVFEAFRQVDGSITRKHGGAGLGLSLAQEFARLLGGEIKLMHSSSAGSTFSLFLPDACEQKMVVKPEE